MHRQLLVMVAAASMLVVVILLVPTLVLLRWDGEHTAELEAARRASVLAAVAALMDDRSLPIAPQDGYAATVFLPAGRTLGVPAPRSPEVTRAAACRPMARRTNEGYEALAAVPLAGSPGCAAVVRVLALPEALRGRSGLLGVLVITLAAAAVGVGLILATQLGRGLLRSTRELALAAGHIAAGDLTARVVPSGPAEIRSAADQLNQLAGRVEQLLDGQRQRAADIAHQLRTPLTGLRLDIDALPEQAGTRRLVAGHQAVVSALNEVIRSSRLAPDAPTVRPVDVVSAVRNRVRFWSVLAEDTGRTIHTELADGPLLAALDHKSLDAALDALFGNVFTHTPGGTTVWVRVKSSPTGVLLVMEDNGPGFPDLDVISRGQSGGSSTGLGMDIARRAAEGSGGWMSLASSAGGGACVALSFGPPSTSPRVPEHHTRSSPALAAPENVD